MSLSLTSVLSYTVARLASVSSTVPPLGELVDEVTTCPSATLRAITVPALGARMVTSSSAMRARSSWVRAAVRDDCALAYASRAFSSSGAVTTPCCTSDRLRSYCVRVTSGLRRRRPHRRRRLVEAALRVARVDAHEQVPGLHLRARGHGEPRDLPRRLGAHLDRVEACVMVPVASTSTTMRCRDAGTVCTAAAAEASCLVHGAEQAGERASAAAAVPRRSRAGRRRGAGAGGAGWSMAVTGKRAGGPASRELLRWWRVRSQIAPHERLELGAGGPRGEARLAPAAAAPARAASGP
jgi:hypothetical protein